MTRRPTLATLTIKEHIMALLETGPHTAEEILAGVAQRGRVVSLATVRSLCHKGIGRGELMAQPAPESGPRDRPRVVYVLTGVHHRNPNASDGWTPQPWIHPIRARALGLKR